MDTVGHDRYFTFDEERLAEFRASKPWVQDPKYFKKVKISPSAAMKMLLHSNSGVEKGMAGAGGKPVEVMGLMLGRPDYEQHGSLIVTDVFPLPIEGAETRVLADDVQVINYMIKLGEALERTRRERFMGWYHSHPFDVEAHSHAFLSSTDISTQLQWQRSEDPHGNPWLAIVIDPLRSLAKGRLELGAFRAYPPEFSPPPNIAPDGRPAGAGVVERWGAAWPSYYCLESELFSSRLGGGLTGLLSNRFLWASTLSSTPMLEKESHERFAERVAAASEKLEAAESGLRLGSGRGGGMSESVGGKRGKEDSALQKAALSTSELALELCQGQATQLVKQALFNSFTG